MKNEERRMKNWAALCVPFTGLEEVEPCLTAGERSEPAAVNEEWLCGVCALVAQLNFFIHHSIILHSSKLSVL